MSVKEEIKKQRAGKPERITAPKRTIDFQVDTLQTAPDNNFAAYMSFDRNSITENYVVGEDNSFNQSLSTKAHEQKHRDNNIAGLKTLPMSLEQYYKVCCHDEISATICELLQLRQEYIDAPTAEARKKLMADNPKFDYYFDYIKEGEINPLSKDAASFEKEMKIIAIETKNYWMMDHASSYDHTSHTSMTLWFFNEHSYDELRPNNANYAKARKIAYTIGGIDFSKYMDDIKCINPNMKTADKQIAANKPRNVIESTLKPINTYMDEENFVYDFKKVEFKPIEGLSPSQQYRLAQHQLFVANMVNQYQFMFDDDIRETIKKGKMLNYDETVEFTIKNIQNIKQKYPQFQAKWAAFEKQIAAEIADNHNSTLFLEKGNDKKYQEELAKIYTVNGINLRQFYKGNVEKLIPNNIPESIKAVENSSWYSRLGNKCSNAYDAVTSMFSSKENPKEETEEGKKAKWKDDRYTGTPKYPEWSPDKRVSPVQYAEIYDFTQPFLNEQLCELKLKEQIAQNKVNETKMAQGVRKKQQQKPDDVYARKAPVQKKAEFKGKESETWTAVKNWWNETFGR